MFHYPQFIIINKNMSSERSDGTNAARINPADILREADALCIRFQWEWLTIEDAKKKATYTLKVKYSQSDI